MAFCLPYTASGCEPSHHPDLNLNFWINKSELESVIDTLGRVVATNSTAYFPSDYSLTASGGNLNAFGGQTIRIAIEAADTTTASQHVDGDDVCQQMSRP